jgi:uncharacterized repeat protein (TIGR03803 family)
VKRLVAIFAVVLALALTAGASTEKVLLNFDGSDGADPWSNYFISDAKGNLYGATGDGGTYGDGVVFMLTLAGKETVLYEFKGQANGDGAAPHGHLAFDANGNIYGTTQAGGTNGTGTVYELSPKSGGGWKEKVLYSFSASGTTDGTDPSAGMTIAADGTMYSTTPDGGAYQAGVIFSMKKTSKGWKQTVIKNLDNSSTGGYPYEGLMMDTAGNLYGAAPTGGASGQGVIYRLSPTKKGWVDTVIHSFTNENGGGSGLYWIDLISDKSGNIYGATSFGGTNGTGTVWELVYSETKKSYSESVLYEFGASGSGDGNNPYGGLAMDSEGNLYGTTLNGGASNLGTSYKLTKHGKIWKETVLHSFLGANDGSAPTGNAYLDAKGRVYGMAEVGGTSNLGVVYRITP